MRAILLSACMSFASAAFAQISSFTLDAKPDAVIFTFNPPKGFRGPAVTGAPFSADEVIESVKTLANGTHISDPPGVQHMIRDSQGRVRNDRRLFQTSSIIEIRDPVDDSYYILDPYNKVAHRFSTPKPARAGTAETWTTSPVPKSEIKEGEFHHEKLGSQLIEGVMANGERSTHTWPAGSAGNDQPFESIDEFWFSPELSMLLLRKRSDPRFGETTIKLINIVRAEPDPALLRPPQDYRIIDETAAFTITVPRKS